MTICICGKETSNPKFCSRSCAAKYNNKLFPKRKKKVYICKICGITLEGRKQFCEKHNPQIIDWSNVTYNNMSVKRNYQKNSRIRSLARDIYNKSNKVKKCKICNYDKHCHVCHIKPISSFSGDTPISVINNINNLIALCPNHHWELDHGLLPL